MTRLGYVMLFGLPSQDRSQEKAYLLNPQIVDGFLEPDGTFKTNEGQSGAPAQPFKIIEVKVCCGRSFVAGLIRLEYIDMESELNNRFPFFCLQTP